MFGGKGGTELAQEEFEQGIEQESATLPARTNPKVVCQADRDEALMRECEDCPKSWKYDFDIGAVQWVASRPRCRNCLKEWYAD